MSTSVKLDEEDKAKLEKLQALLTLKHGRKVTQQELLSGLIGSALEKDEETAQLFFGADKPMSDKEFSKTLALVSDWGVEDASQKIDEYLYGSRGRTRRSRDA
jgi:hypothetical protein